MAEVHPPGAEHEINHEVHTPYAPMEGLQLRFLLGDRYIDPEVDIPTLVRAEDIPPLDRRDNSMSRNATTQSRIAETEKLVHEHVLPEDLAGQKREWIKNTTRVLLLPQNQERLQKLTPLFNKLGMGPVNNQSIQHLYERVFANKALPKYKSNGKTYLNTDEDFFIKAVLDRHTQLGRLNYNEFKNNIEEYRWFAKIFGAERQEAIVQRLDAYAQFKTNPFGVINPGMNLINGHPRAAIINLTDREKQIMAYELKYSKRGLAAAATDHGHGNGTHGNGTQGNGGDHSAQAGTGDHGNNGQAGTPQQTQTPGSTVDQQPPQQPNPNTSPPNQAETAPIQNISTETEAQTKTILDQLKITDRLERQNAETLRSHLVDSEAMKNGLPVFYMNAGKDIKHPLAYTDATDFIFVDEHYADDSGNINSNFELKNSIEEIGGTNIITHDDGKLGNGGKRTVEFDFAGKRRRISQYGKDANAPGFRAYENKAGLVMGNDIKTTEAAFQLLKNVASEGYTTYSPVSMLYPELVGFERKVTGVETYDPTKTILPLYHKIWSELSLNSLLRIDRQLLGAIIIRDGIGKNIEITNDTLTQFREQLIKLETEYNSLSPFNKEKLLNNLQRSLGLEQGFTEYQRTYLPKSGKKMNLDDSEKALKYLEDAYKVALEIFPEIMHDDISPLPPDKLMLPTKRPEILAEEITALNDESKEEQFKKFPAYYANAAAVFADGLRSSLAAFGVPSPEPNYPISETEKGYLFVYPNIKFKIVAKDKVDIADAEFDPQPFLDWADYVRMPLVYYATPDRTTLLIKGPHKVNNEWQVKIYDPTQGESDIVLHPSKDMGTFGNERNQYYRQYYKADKKSYIVPHPNGSQIQIPEQDLNSQVFQEWLRQPGTLPDGNKFISNNLGNRYLEGNAYDLTIPSDEGLQEEFISAKDARIQFDKKNNIPVGMFAAVVRYITKPNRADRDPKAEKLRREKIAEEMIKRFHIPVLTYEEIMSDDFMKVNEDQKNQSEGT